MTKAEAMQVISAKLPSEVIEDYTRFAAEVATSRNALFLEALEAYLAVLRSGRRTLRESRLKEAG